MNQYQIVGGALVTGLRYGREIGRITHRQMPAQFGSARLQQVEKGAASPVFRGLTFIGPPIVQYFERVGGIGAPAKGAALVNRMQGVENDEATRQLNAGVGEAPAETGHQLGFGAADQTRFRHPPRNLVKSRFVHVLVS